MWRMIHVMAANSLAHSLTDLDAEEERKKLGQITAITGFALKFNHLKDNLMLWHNVINDCLTSHSIEDLIKNLEDRNHHIRAIIGN